MTPERARPARAAHGRHEAVALASSRARWVGGTGDRRCTRQGGKREVPHFASYQAAGQPHRVDHPAGQRLGACQRVVESASGGVEKREVEADVVPDEDRVVAKLEEGRKDGLDPGRLTNHRFGDAGQDRDEGRYAGAGVHESLKVPITSPPRYLTAPISVISQVLAEAPVVSRSSTQKVTAWRGIPRSPKAI